MKQYLVIDIYSDYKEEMNYKDLKQLLIEELARDTKDNYKEWDIVSINVEIFSKLALEDYTSVDYLLEHLEGFGYKVIDLLDTQRDLEDIKVYFKGKGSAVFDNVIDMINKGVKDNG